MLVQLTLHVFLVQPVLSALLASKRSPLPKSTRVRLLICAGLFVVGVLFSLHQFHESREPNLLEKWGLTRDVTDKEVRQMFNEMRVKEALPPPLG